MNRLNAFWNSPVGPKTSHFWGPVFNWGFVLQGAIEYNRPAEKISRDMQMTLTQYSTMFMRFALKVQPTNYLLFTCHFLNVFVQGRQLKRRVEWEWEQEELQKGKTEIIEPKSLELATTANSVSPITQKPSE